MSTQYYTASSLDGFIADADNSLDWLLQLEQPPPDSYNRFIADVGALVMGSTTYDWILDHEILADPGNPRPWPYAQPTWVLSSRRLRRIESGDIRFGSGDVGTVHKQATDAAAGRNIWLVGGGDLVGQFHDRRLLDEVIVSIAPVTLGRGAPVLPRRIVDQRKRRARRRADLPTPPRPAGRGRTSRTRSASRPGRTRDARPRCRRR